MKKKMGLNQTLKKANYVKKASFFILFFLHLLKNVCVTFALVLCCLVSQKNLSLISMFFSCLLIFIFLCIVDSRKKFRKIQKNELAIFAEISSKKMKHSEKTSSFFNGYIRNLIRSEFFRSIKCASVAIIPGLIFLVNLTAIKADVMDPFYALSLHYIKKDKMVLSVLEGSLDSHLVDIELNKNEIKNIRLTSPNLIHMVYETYDKSKMPFLRLEPKDKEKTLQSIQMEMETQDKLPYRFSISFSLSEEMEIFSPSFSHEPILSVAVEKSHNPEVHLSLKEKKEEWDDSELIVFQIKSVAKNNISKIVLKLQIGHDQFQELVVNFENQTLKENESEFSLSPSKYLTSDTGQLDVFAEVSDANLPEPLVGKSNVIHLALTSSYGRYKKSLSILHNIKLEIDAWEDEGDKVQKDKVNKLMNSALLESEKITFFDNFDRFQLRQFQDLLSKVSSKEDILPPLSQFLEEHESLDDRERDRDFFVALRFLSKMVSDQKYEKIQKMIENINEFLTQRKERWAARVRLLPPAFQPSLWNEIEKKDPFLKAMQKVHNLSQHKKPPADSLEVLVALSDKYKKWIEALEEAEDKALEEKKKERNQHLASARNELQKLQKQQAEISEVLDKAKTKDKANLKDLWPSLMLKQNGNIKDTAAIEGSMRTFLPQLSKRIGGAKEAMTITRDSGDLDDFEKAETYSDMASRLLRLAEKKSYEEQDSRKERRQKISGNQYYGQSIVNGDVQIDHDYKVDKRYRQDILDEVKGTEANEQEEVLLKNYLRNVVR